MAEIDVFIDAAPIDIHVDSAPIDINISAAQGPVGPNVITSSTASDGTANLSIASIAVSGSASVDNVTFDQTPELAGGIGVMRWNDSDGTLDLGLKGGNVTLQLGQEEVVRVVNKTGSDLLESQYKVVRIRLASEGGAQGQRLAVVLAQGNNDPDSVTTLGVVTENIPNNQEGFITISGNVRNINTTGSLQGESWVDGDLLYLSPTVAGGLTKVKPQAPSHTVTIGYVVYSHANNGKLFVKIDNGYEINELHDVLISNPTTGQFLKRNAGNTLWVNSSIVSADVTDATDANTPSTIVKRNPAGGFNAGAIEADSLTVGSHQVSGFGLSKGNRSLNFPNTSAATPQTILIPESGGTLALTNDPRFTDARTPLAHTHFSSDITDASPSNGAYTIVKRDGDGSAAFNAVTADYLVGSTEVLAGGYGNGMGLYSDGIRFYANDVQSLLQTAAINSTSQTYTLPDASGTIVLDVDLGTIASKNYTQSSTPPVSPAQGDQWLDTSTGMKFEYNGTFWVDVAGAAVTQGNVRLALASGANVQLPTTQAATDANSAMTRLLSSYEVMLSGNEFRQTVLISSQQTGTGANAGASSVVGMNAAITTTAASSASAYTFDNIISHALSSGTPMPSNKEIDFVAHGVCFRVETTTNWVIRVNFGVGTSTRTPPAAGAAPATSRQWGVEFYYNGINYVGRLYYYDTSVVYGTEFTVPGLTAGNSVSMVYAIRMRQTATGTLEVYLNSPTASNGGNRLPTTPTSTLSATWTGTTFAGRHINFEVAAASAAGPTSQARIFCSTMFCRYVQ